MGLAGTAIPRDFPFNILFQNGIERQAVYERTIPINQSPAMPARTLLSAEQRTKLFSIPTDTATMARHYVLDAADLAIVRARRRASNRLGFAVQLCVPGTHPPPPESNASNRNTKVSYAEEPSAYTNGALRVSTRNCSHPRVRPTKNEEEAVV